MFAKPKRLTVEPGERYQARAAGYAQATATVMAVDRRAGGIAHVRYDIRLALPSGAARAEANRMVALSRFVDLFPDALASPGRDEGR